MEKSQILEKMEILDHDERWQQMVALGQKACTDQKLAQALSELAASGVHHERLLALMSAHGSHDAGIIEKLLADTSNLYIGTRVKLAAKFLDADVLVRVVPELSRIVRAKIYMALFQAGRSEVCDALYSRVGARDQQKLLPLTTQAFLFSHLSADYIGSLDKTGWARLAHRFPDKTLAVLEEILNIPMEPSWQAQTAVRQVLRKLYDCAPETGLKLLQLAMTRMRADNLCLHLYVQLFPDDVARLILAQPTVLQIKWPLNSLMRLDTQLLCDLVNAGAVSNLESAFSHLKPAQRGALYETCKESWRLTNGALPLSYVVALPSQKARELEARHAFGLTLLAALPMQRLAYLSVLPWDEALILAAPYLEQPEGELRAQALGALVGCGRYDVSSLENILNFCIKRENEQDPVRLAMMQALARLPAGRWQEKHQSLIEQIIAAALKARDCSHQTMQVCIRWLFGMVVFHTDFVVTQLPLFVERLGGFSVPSVVSRINDRQAVRLGPVFMPIFRTWISRSRSNIVLSVISCFGQRVKVMPEFIQTMVELAHEQREHIARSSLAALYRLKLTDTLKSLIPELLEKDQSWILVNEVAGFLHRRRQSLLTPFLSLRIYRGLFKSGTTATVPGFNHGFARWTAHQQMLYAHALYQIIGSKKRSAWELYSNVARLVEMPSIDLNPLAAFARLDAKDPALRDKVLEALGRADAGRGTPVLLDALDDARARVAIYALRKAVLNMPAHQALMLLGNVSSKKVTVVKEVLRLVGEFENDEAYAYLNQAAEEQDLHPDVYIALLRAYWGFLNRESVWLKFHTAARSPRAALARSTVHIPQKGLSAQAMQALCRQMVLLLQHSDAQVRLDTMMRLVDMPLGIAADTGSPGADLRRALILHLDDIDPQVCFLAAQALLANNPDAQSCRDVAAAFAHVQQAHALVAVVNAFEARKRVNTMNLAACAQMLADALLERRWQPAQIVKLVLLVCTATDALDFIYEAGRQSLLHPGVVSTVGAVWDSVISGGKPQSYETMQTKLQQADDAALRRMGLSLLCALACQYGWTTLWRKRLNDYRHDPSLWVRDAAELVKLPQPVSMP